MNLLRLPVVLTLVCASLLNTGAKAQADVVYFYGNSYAAIAYSPATGKWGYSYNWGSRGSAEAVALRNCEASDARIVVWVCNGFCALALGDDKSCWDTGFCWGDGATTGDARNQALQGCRQRTTNVRVVLCISSNGVVIQK